MKYLFLRLLGVATLWRWLNRKKITILVIHGVMSAELNSRWVPLRWQLDPRVLERCLRTLKRHYTFVSADEAVDIISGAAPARNNCMLVTIDDAYLNAHRCAFPILKQYGIRPLLFVVSSKLENSDYFWFDYLDLCIQETAKSRSHIEFRGRRVDIDRHDRSAMTIACREIMHISRQDFADDSTRMHAIRELIDDLEFPNLTDSDSRDAVDQWIGIMNADDVRSAIAGGMDIGSHTVSHARLVGMNEEGVKREVAESKTAIELATGNECKYFCYPEGGVDNFAAEAISASNYRAAFTSNVGLAAVGDDLMLLKRIHMPQPTDDAELLVVVSGLRDAVSGIKKSLMRRIEKLSGSERVNAKH